MNPVKLILIALLAVFYIALLITIFKMKETTEKVDGKDVVTPLTFKAKAFMVISATGIGGLLTKLIIEWG